MNKNRKGFTLIEMLIVIAVIGILASVVLIGLGPVQRKGRDARRVADLREVQTALELYFNKCGFYPGEADCTGDGAPPANAWEGLRDAVIDSELGIKQLPNDPRTGVDYEYDTDGTSYVLKAVLEDVGSASLKDDVDGAVFGLTCDDDADNPEAEQAYCVQL